MNELKILDASAIVYTGEAAAQAYGNQDWFGYPCGGLRRLNKYIALAFANDDAVVVAFDSPNFRTETLPTYKSGRNANPNVISQLKLAYEMLNRSGVYCDKLEGYEADDIIDWASKLASNFSLVEIIGNDYDLVHSVGDNVAFVGCSSNVLSINSVTFKALNSTYPGLEYNTISAYKVFYGCKSDGIQPFVSESGMKPTEMYSKFVAFTRENGYTNVWQHQSPELLAMFILSSNLFTEKDKEDLGVRIDLVYPAKMPDDYKIHINTVRSYNRKEFANYCTLIGDDKTLGLLQMEKANLSAADKNKLEEYKKMLYSGSFAVDNDIPVDSTIPGALPSSVFIRDF